MLLFNELTEVKAEDYLGFKYILCYCSTTVKSRFLKIKNTINLLIFQGFIENLPGDLTFGKSHWKTWYKPF